MNKQWDNSRDLEKARRAAKVVGGGAKSLSKSTASSPSSTVAVRCRLSETRIHNFCGIMAARSAKPGGQQ